MTIFQIFATFLFSISLMILGFTPFSKDMLVLENKIFKKFEKTMVCWNNLVHIDNLGFDFIVRKVELITAFLSTFSLRSNHTALSSLQSSGRITMDKRKIARLAIFPNFSSATLRKLLLSLMLWSLDKESIRLCKKYALRSQTPRFSYNVDSTTYYSSEH